MAKFRRRIFLTDIKVQGALMLRVLSYWLYCLFTISMLLVWWDLFTGPPRAFLEVIGDVYLRFLPAAGASLFILPLAMMDLLRMSNRFTGPARRLKNALQDLGDSKPVANVTFRDNDFWKEMAAGFNRVNDRVNQLEARLKPAPTAAEADEQTEAADAELVGQTT